MIVLSLEFSLVQGSVYTIDQWSSGKYIDAIETLDAHNYAAELSLAEGGAHQLWYLQPLQRNSGGSSEWRIVQCSTGRILDAFVSTENTLGETKLGRGESMPVVPTPIQVLMQQEQDPAASSVGSLMNAAPPAPPPATANPNTIMLVHTVAEEQADFTQRWVTLPIQKKPSFDGYYALRQKSSGKYLTMALLHSVYGDEIDTRPAHRGLELSSKIADGTVEEKPTKAFIRIIPSEYDLSEFDEHTNF